MIINIPTKLDLVFKQYLYIVNGVLSKDKKLTPIEIDILDKLIYIDYLYRALPKDKRDEILFHKETKVRIRKSILDTSEASYNNIISSLRKKGIIKGKSLITRIPIKDNKITLQFTLDIKDDESNSN